MLKLTDFDCIKCGKREEHLVDESEKPMHCGEYMQMIFSFTSRCNFGMSKEFKRRELKGQRMRDYLAKETKDMQGVKPPWETA